LVWAGLVLLADNFGLLGFVEDIMARLEDGTSLGTVVSFGLSTP
jgi:hypothetical protein